KPVLPVRQGKIEGPWPVLPGVRGHTASRMARRIIHTDALIACPSSCPPIPEPRRSLVVTRSTAIVRVTGVSAPFAVVGGMGRRLVDLPPGVPRRCHPLPVGSAALSPYGGGVDAHGWADDHDRRADGVPCRA